MTQPPVVTKSVTIPESLLFRLRELRKVYNVKLTQLVRDGLEQQIVALEKKHQEDLAREVAIRQAKEDRKKARSRRTVGGALGTLPAFEPLLPGGAKTKTSSPTLSYADDELYERAARTLLGVSSAEEAKKRAKDAVGLVQSERRLSAPSEAEILARLEENFLRLRGQKAPETRTYDDLVGAVVNLDKIKTVSAPSDTSGDDLE